MKFHRFSRDTNPLGTVWFLVPVLWIVAALAGYVVLNAAPEVFAGATPAQAASGAGTLSFMPAAGIETPVPDAASVFRDRPYEVSEHVATF